GGSISYSQPVVTDGNSLERAKQQIQNLTQYKSFEPTYLIVGTWDRVGYYERKNDSLNTFQCVVATDGDMTFAIFLYNQLEWSQGQNSA
ncbi:Sushi, nidogen and EGF-like domain-containing protein 1, partial [Geodia barretti]